MTRATTENPTGGEKIDDELGNGEGNLSRTL